MPHDGGATDMPNSASETALVIDETFPTDFRWVRRWVQNTVDALAELGVPHDDQNSVEIVLAEALNNVVEHAYPKGTIGKVRLVVRKRKKALMVEIRDYGRPMPEGRAPIGNHPMTEFNKDDAMPEGGYGWFLIREIVRDLVYDRRDDENMLLFRIKLEEAV